MKKSLLEGLPVSSENETDHEYRGRLEMPKVSKFKVVNLNLRDDLNVEREILEKIDCEVTQGSGKTSEDIIQTANDAHALIGGGQPINRAVLGALERLRIVSLIGVGYDTVDIAAATEMGILVTHVPDLITDIVADHAIALILSLIRRVPQGDRLVKKNAWQSTMPRWAKPVPRLRGLTVGIIGLGRTGRNAASKLKAFGVRVIAYDPYVKSEASSEVTLVQSLEELLRQSDVISIHVFLSSETKHMIGKRELQCMKRGSFLVNTSRGAAIDEGALFEALDQEWISGAALDVMEKEPPDQNNPLLTLENIIITPHVAYYSDESLVDQRKRTADEITRMFQGLPPLHPVNPQVLSHLRKQLT